MKGGKEHRGLIMASAAVGNRCHVHLLDNYLSKLHPKAQLDCFYMQPLGVNVVADPAKNWFSAQPCGKNKLSSMVKNMFEMVGIEGKTNHSLRATGATEMFRVGVPEKNNSGAYWPLLFKSSADIRTYNSCTASVRSDCSHFFF